MCALWMITAVPLHYIFPLSRRANNISWHLIKGDSYHILTHLWPWKSFYIRRPVTRYDHFFLTAFLMNSISWKYRGAKRICSPFKEREREKDLDISVMLRRMQINVKWAACVYLSQTKHKSLYQRKAAVVWCNCLMCFFSVMPVRAGAKCLL